jgi:hypothetical protein
MGLSSKLCNATPWEQVIPWHRTKIVVPGDGHVELFPEQLEDFRPGKAGSEEVRNLLNTFGCFLMDTDRSYDVQVFECLQGTIKARKQQYTDFVANIRNDRIRAGQNSVTEEDLEGVIEMQGYKTFRDQIENLERRVQKLRNILAPAGELGGRRQAPKFDPERTCFGTSPPREFPTKLALELFLDENPEAAEKHKVFMFQMNKAAKKATPVVEE